MTKFLSILLIIGLFAGCGRTPKPEQAQKTKTPQAKTAPAQKTKSAKDEKVWENAKMEEGWSTTYYKKFVPQATVSGRDLAGSGGEALAHDFEIQTFRNGNTNQVQIIAKTPACFFDPEMRTAHSTNQLRIYAPSNNFSIEGRGFYCAYTNAILILSNDVVTRLDKSVIKSSIASATNQAATNLLWILSESGELRYESNLVIYTGNVRVKDPQMQMNCEQLIGRFNTNRFHTNAGFEHVTASGNVVITIPNKGRATGDKAVYLMNGQTESIELTGHATWNDGQREAKATRFTFDRNRFVLEAHGDVVVKFPNGMLSQTNMASPLTAAGATTNGYTELFADHATIQLSQSNGPPQSILAENNIVITNRFDHSRATADRALYTSANERVELTGAPYAVWQTVKGEARGRMLSIEGRTNRTFSSVGNSRLTLNLPEKLARQAKASETNRYMVVTSDSFEYRTNDATFTKDVHAEIFQGTDSAGTLACQFLKIIFGPTNHVEKILAQGRIRGYQSRTTQIEGRSLNCETLSATLWPGTDSLRDVSLDGDVQVTEIGPSPQAFQMNAGLVKAHFLPNSTNTIEHAEATTNMRGLKFGADGTIIQINSDQTIYTYNTDEPFEITGKPEVRYWPGKTGGLDKGPLIQTGAQGLYLNPITKKFRSRGGVLVKLTNAPPAAPKINLETLP